MPKFEMNPYVNRYLKRQADIACQYRTPSWVGPDDVVQDGKAYWHIVNEKYEDVVTEVAHMVALWKTTFRNHVHDLSNVAKKHKVCDSLEAITEESGDQPEFADVESHDALISEAPEPIRTILRLLTSGGERILAPPFRPYLDGTRDSVNKRLHRALAKAQVAVDPDADLLKLVYLHLRRTKRERLHEEPTLLELVGALVDSYLSPELPAPSVRDKLFYPPDKVKVAKDKIKLYLKPKPKVRERIFPVVEVKQRADSRSYHSQSGVRCRTSDPQPRVKVSQHPRTSVRPRVHGDWADCRYQRVERRGDADRLRHPEGTDAREGSRTVGPRAPAVARGPTCENPHGRPRAAAGASRGSQDSTAAVHPNGRKPRTSSLRTSRSTTGRA